MTDIAITQVATDILLPAHYNPREIDDASFARLKRGIESFGLVDPIIARRSDNMVIGGHQRLRAATDLKLATVPVVYLDEIADDEAAALNVLLNNPGAQGEWEFSKLADLISELDANGFDATLTGFDPDEIEKLLTWTPDGAKEGLTDPDAVPEAPETPTTQTGDLWLLGKHRLACGDATDSSTVDRLLDGAKPLLMVTDPPYGVEYDPTWRSNNRTGAVKNDDQADWTSALELHKGDVSYVWHASIHVSTVARSIDTCGFQRRAYLIWAKQNHTFGRGHYHWQHEACWYAVREGKTASWTGDRKQSTLWQVDNVHPTLGTIDDGETVHGTQKPVEIMERPLHNHDATQVYDPFVGSGTTIIAAERQSRACYALDIDPAYTDVCVLRWEAFTGQKATLNGDGRTFAQIKEERVIPAYK